MPRPEGAPDSDSDRSSWLSDFIENAVTATAESHTNKPAPHKKPTKKTKKKGGSTSKARRSASEGEKKRKQRQSRSRRRPRASAEDSSSAGIELQAQEPGSSSTGISQEVNRSQEVRDPDDYAHEVYTTEAHTAAVMQQARRSHGNRRAAAKLLVRASLRAPVIFGC